MDIDVTQSSGVAVLSPRGDLDMATVHDVRRALSSVFDRGQSRLLIDLNAVAYIDSSGIGELVSGRIAGRDDRAQVTLFKSLGMAVEDVAAAHLAWIRAKQRGLGREVAL